MTFFNKAKSESRPKRLFGGDRQEPRLRKEEEPPFGPEILEFAARLAEEQKAEESGAADAPPVRARRVTRGRSEATGPDGTAAHARPESRASDAFPPAAPAFGSEETPPVRRRIWDAAPEIGEDGERFTSSTDIFKAPGPEAPDLSEEDETQAAARPWGQEAEPDAAEAGADPVDESDVAFARTQLARLKELDIPMDDGPEAGQRTRTRVLGFGGIDPALGHPFTEGTEAGDEDAAPGFAVGWLVVVDGPGLGRSFTLTQGVATIGRGADQVVRLDFGDTAISRNAHASVVYDDESNCYYLGAGTKSNVVRRNDRPVLATEEMQDGDLIRLGETTLRFVALCNEAFRWGDRGGEARSHG